jgi:CHAT domain-containing protein/tetratricopeptide (TPR) repeat protein
MMKGRLLLGLILTLPLAASAASTQPGPADAPKGRDSVADLVAACVKAGGLSKVPAPGGKGTVLQLVDREKLRHTVAQRRQHLTSALPDQLMNSGLHDGEGSKAAFAALLEAYGHAKGDRRALGLALILAGRMAHDVRDYGEAERCYRAAAKEFAAVGAENWRARSLNGLGAVLHAQANYGEALDCCLQVLVIDQQLRPKERYPQGHPKVAAGLSNVAQVLHDRGQYGEALSYGRRALAMRQSLYPADRFPQGHLELWVSLNNMGGLLQSEGAYGEALGYFRQALTMAQTLYPEPRDPEGSLFLARSLHNMGTALQYRGAYDEALGYDRQALAMLRKLYPPERYPDGHPLLASSLNDQGAGLRKLGRYAEALDYYRQALAMLQQLYPEGRYPRGHADLARGLNNLAESLAGQGHYGEALSYYRQALATEQKLYPPEHYPQGHIQLATSLNNLGWLLESQGSHEEALRNYEAAAQALRTTPEAVNLRHGAQAASLLRLCPLTALVLANRAGLVEQALPKSPSTADLRRCERAYALAAAVQERLRGEVLRHDDDRLQHGEAADVLLPRRVGLLGRLFQAEGKPEHLRAAFAALERGRARLFLESLGEAHAAELAGLPDDLRQQERRLALRLRELDARVERLQGQPGQEPARLVGERSSERLKVEEEQRRLLASLTRSHPQYAGLRYPRPYSVEQARACLAPDEVALLFAVGADASYVLLVEKEPAAGDKGEGLAVFRLPSSKELAPAVATLLARETLLHAAGARDRAALLYRKLLGPLEKRLAGKNLVLVPDGVLALLPFELLVAGQTENSDGQFLVERHRIRYVPSLSALHLSKRWLDGRKALPDRPLWALADPVFDDKDARLQRPADPVQVAAAVGRFGWLLRGEGGFRRLQHTGAEVEAIRKVLAADCGALLLGPEATEARVRAASDRGELARARYVHFATHGLFGLERGQPPGLVLSLVGNDNKEVPGGVNDGFLRLPEVTFLKLNADLVVLSACETGKGVRSRGEGVSGLARAFLYAGSKGVVCSLWSVDDERTAELMADLYRGLKGGWPTAEALRAAQLRMIAQGRAPFYWAPFVLMGQ